MNFVVFKPIIRYNELMSKTMNKDQILREAMHLQAIEGNPLDANQIAMFEMFERKGWSNEKRLAHIQERAQAASMVPAAE